MYLVTHLENRVRKVRMNPSPTRPLYYSLRCTHSCFFPLGDIPSDCDQVPSLQSPETTTRNWRGSAITRMHQNG